ncbi:MAG: B12-binding domain-containing radical SAM protein [Ignisphaera sp.]|nr:B12-binding domain-containing radical SAM protein [Ignisphaera sp.]MCX8168199.1 B12-binding domain-containing radical SAM protein [Ignisphaera sp.]MDW8084931.1 radical SAM protein [Ignisphaera sp.]
MNFVIRRIRKETVRFEKKGRPGNIKVGILIPMPYSAAVNSLFFQTSYEYINSLEGAVAYRYVYDVKNDILEALDMETNFNSLDAILISLSFELDYVVLARILDKLGLLHRYKGYKKPILIAGGIAVTSNPLPLSGIVDAVVIGEVDDILEDLVYTVGEDNPLNHLENFYCISTLPIRDRVRRCFTKDLNRAPHSVNQFYDMDEEPVYGYGMRIELSRGCPYLCAFCMEGHIQHPFRYRAMEVVWRMIEKGLGNSITKKVIFYSLALFSVPFMDRLIEKLIENSIKASLPSLRVDHITKERLESIRELGQRTVTIAPETLVKSLACSIGKCYDIGHLENIISESLRCSFEHVKLYLITGFPKLDLNEEINEFKRILSKLSWVKKARFLRIVLNPLIPKPWTPYQFLPPAAVLNLAENINKYYKEARKFTFVRIESYNHKWAFAQAVIAQGNEEISDLIINWGRYGFSLNGFYRALRSLNKESTSFIYHGWEELPWYKFIDMGLPIDYFKMRYHYLIN